MSINISDKILKLARAVREHGGRALLVGGCVRDRLMSWPVKDWDAEIYGLDPATLRAVLDQLGQVNVVGEAFTVYKLGHDLDVSLPRRERKAGRGHRAFVIEGDPAMSFEEAARRRDFTVNAILEDPLTGEIIDPFGGRRDLENKTLRAVAPETFVEDSLRVLRAAQFAARFEFDVEPETIELCRRIDLTDLPPERVWGETEKLLLRSRRPSVGLQWLEKLGATAQLFPELKELVGCPQESEWHPEGWVIKAMSPEPFVTGMAQTVRMDRGLFTLREFLTGSATSPTVIPTSNSATRTQPTVASLPGLPATDGTGTQDFFQPPVARPAVNTQAESLVWSFGTFAPRTDKIIRVVFKISLNRMLSIVRGAVNDFEIVRGVVHPVAVFVVNVLPAFQQATEHQFRNNAMHSDSAVFTLPTGVHVTSVVVDARTAAVDNNVLFYFDLAFIRDGDFVHDGDDPPRVEVYGVEMGDVWYHTLLVADRARELIDDLHYPRQVTVMLAALCHDFGKPATTAFVDGRIRSRGHEEAGVAPTESFLDRLKMHTLDGYDVRAQVVALVRDHLKPGEFYRKRDEVGDGAFRRLAQKCELDLLYRVARADSLGRNADWVPREKWFDAAAEEWFIRRARELMVDERPPEKILMGRHLLEMGMTPSPSFSRILNAVYEMQLDGRVRTLEEAKEAARKLIH